MEKHEPIEHPTTPEKVERGLERGLTTDLLATFAEGAAGGAGVVAGKAAAEQVIDTIKHRPEPESSSIILPPGVESDE